MLGCSARMLQDFSVQLRTFLLDLPALMAAEKSGQTFGLEAPHPQLHRVDATAHLAGHCSDGLTFGAPENDIRTPNVLGRQSSATDARLKFKFSGGRNPELCRHPQNLSETSIRTKCYS